MTRQEKLERCFDTIMDLKCADEFKEMITRLHVLIKNKTAYSLNGLSLPNYLWVAKRGGGMTTMIKIFAEYLYAARAIEFCGKEKSFEFKLKYIAPGSYFSELIRLDQTIASNAGHNRFYKGIVCINIDEWIEHSKEEHFELLLDYISDNKDKLLVVFCIQTDDKKHVETVASMISSHMRIETLALSFPEATDLVDLIESKYINSRRFFLSEKAKALLHETIEELSGSDHFGGFKTISRLAEDIMHDVLSTGLGVSTTITTEMLSRYRKDSTYVQRAVTRSGKRAVIGFAGREL